MIEGEGVVTPESPSAAELDEEYFEWKNVQEEDDRQVKKGGKKFFGRK